MYTRIAAPSLVNVILLNVALLNITLPDKTTISFHHNLHETSHRSLHRIHGIIELLFRLPVHGYGTFH